MDNSKKRNKYLNVNKYQLRIICLSFVPSLLVCIVSFVFYAIFYRYLINILLYGTITDGVNFIHKWSVFILTGISALFVFSFIIALAVSRNLVGAFGRILREVDAVIDGKEKKEITARPRDDLAQALLKRINKLIDGYDQKKP